MRRGRCGELGQETMQVPPREGPLEWGSRVRVVAWKWSRRSLTAVKLRKSLGVRTLRCTIEK